MAGLTYDLDSVLRSVDDLDTVVRALARERVIRDVMRDSGEERQHVADMLDAMISVSQEGVEELTDGQPTTLRDALQRYVESLDTNDPFPLSLVDDLCAILAYPFPGPSVDLEMTDDGHVMKISVGGSALLTVDRGDNTLSSVSSAVQTVHEAVMDRLSRS
jgi:hypothetical protein